MINRVVRCNTRRLIAACGLKSKTPGSNFRVKLSRLSPLYAYGVGFTQRHWVLFIVVSQGSCGWWFEHPTLSHQNYLNSFSSHWGHVLQPAVGWGQRRT
jgi:hypothetical protein